MLRVSLKPLKQLLIYAVCSVFLGALNLESQVHNAGTTIRRLPNAH